MAIFEERPQGYTARADSFGLDLKSRPRDSFMRSIPFYRS